MSTSNNDKFKVEDVPLPRYDTIPQARSDQEFIELMWRAAGKLGFRDIKKLPKRKKRAATGKENGNG